ncbi:hypothetical protein [Gilvimarinus agarilyticus]|uniref:hypothetical protein n=1 Tax=Gilvimarinus agarilyticus TaxID=679259 RepID=UPI0005A180DA|nr:hypothetical protein [Gilvimarinus agarilyticus]
MQYKNQLSRWWSDSRLRLSRLPVACGAVLLSTAAPSMAAPYTPTSADEVLADWGEAVERVAAPLKSSDNNTDTTKLALTRAAEQLAVAAKPGQSFRYQLAERSLAPLSNKSLSAPSQQQYWLLRANVLQHGHRFNEALQELDTLFEQAPNHVAGRLMAARINLVMGQPQIAREHCLALLGQSDLVTAAGCSLEARSYIDSDQGGSLNDSYRELSALIEREGLPSDTRGPWLAQVLAEMATRLDKPQQAVQWLDNFNPRVSTNYLAQWADAQLALGNSAEVLKSVAAVVESTSVVDDALLLRLAIAEKSLALTSDKLAADTDSNYPQPQSLQGATSRAASYWQDLMQARVALREERGDREHAAQMARYYLDIQPDADRALHWAKLNTLSSREYTDNKLLRRAEQLAGRKTHTQSEG